MKIFAIVFLCLLYTPPSFAGRIHTAIIDGNLNLTEMLLRRNIFERIFNIGPTIHSKNKFGETLLHLAVRHNRRPIVILLLDLGADVGARNNNGSTPLHYAANAGYHELAELLILRGAVIYSFNNQSRSPIDLAQGRGYADLVVYLTREAESREPLIAQSSARRAIAAEALEEASELFTAMYREREIEHATEECSVCTRNLLYLEQVVEKCIVQCRNGHRLCGDCRSAITDEICPMCRTAY